MGGMRSYETFLSSLGKMPTKDLVLTRQVLSQRHQIEAQVERINQEVTMGLSIIGCLEKEVKLYKDNRAEIERNKNFEYEVEEEVVYRVDTDETLTNCNLCKTTCHLNCAFPNDDDKHKCCAMDDSGNCTVCTNKCHWSMHKNQAWKWAIKTEKKKKTYAEQKKKYEQAAGKELTCSEVIDMKADEFEATQLTVLALTNEVRECLNRLKEIALKSDPMSHVDYLQQLIEAEKSEHKPGWDKRVKQLEHSLKWAKELETITAQGYDPFRDWKSTSEITVPQHDGLIKQIGQKARALLGPLIT